MSDHGLTKSQLEARDKAWELLKEHFDHVIVAFDTEASEGTDRTFEANYHGGLTAAIGLCERTKNRMVGQSEISDSWGDEDI